MGDVLHYARRPADRWSQSGQGFRRRGMTIRSEREGAADLFVDTISCNPAVPYGERRVVEARDRRQTIPEARRSPRYGHVGGGWIPDDANVREWARRVNAWVDTHQLFGDVVCGISLFALAVTLAVLAFVAGPGR